MSGRGTASTDPERTPAREADPLTTMELHRLLAALPYRERVACIMIYYAGYTEAETAEYLGVSQPTVSRLLKRASVIAKEEA